MWNQTDGTFRFPTLAEKRHTDFIFQLPKTCFFWGHFSSTLRRTGRVSMGFWYFSPWSHIRMRKCLLMRCSRFMDDLVLGGFTVHSRFNVPNHWWLEDDWLEDACHVSDQLLLVFMILQSLWSQEKCSFEPCCDLDLRLPRQLLLSEAVDRLKEAPVGGRWNLDLQLCERKMGQVLQVWHLSFSSCLRYLIDFEMIFSTHCHFLERTPG